MNKLKRDFEPNTMRNSSFPRKQNQKPSKNNEKFFAEISAAGFKINK